MTARKLYTNACSILCLAAVLSASALCATPAVISEDKATTQELKVTVGERPFTLAELAVQQEERVAVAKGLTAQDDEQDVEPSAEMLLASASIRAQMPADSANESSVAKKELSSKSLYTSHPGAFYSPWVVSLFGDTVEFNDGSVWSICFEDRTFTYNWLITDDVIVTPNDEWFSLYAYRLTNQQTGIAVRANLYLGPIYRGIFSYWIVAIDYINGQVCLQDGSIWSMSPIDLNIVRKWIVGDTVIIGVNNNAFASIRPNILINVNTNNYGIGNCLFY